MHDGSEENLNAFEKPHGIGVSIRNFNLLWLDGDEDWENLLSLLRQSEIDDAKLAVLKDVVSQL